MTRTSVIPQVAFSRQGKAHIGFEIFTLNSLFLRYATLMPPLDKPHRVEFYQILFINQGSSTHHIDFRPYQYGKGSILFVSKGQVHEFEIQPNVDGFLILFTEDFLVKNLLHPDMQTFRRLYNYHLEEPILWAEASEDTLIARLINEIYEEFHAADDFAKEDILRLLLKLLLLKVERIKQHLIPPQENSKWLMTFSTFRNLLEAHFGNTRNAKEYARMMDMSYKHLNETCKSVTGKTVKEFIDAFLILETKRHLAISDIAIKELTYQMGFDEPTNFVKFFRKHTGQSPTQFRKEFGIIDI